MKRQTGSLDLLHAQPSGAQSKRQVYYLAGAACGILMLVLFASTPGGGTQTPGNPSRFQTRAEEENSKSLRNEEGVTGSGKIQQGGKGSSSAVAVTKQKSSDSNSVGTDAFRLLTPSKIFFLEAGKTYYSVKSPRLPCEGGCSNRGQCFLGKCFCYAAATGETCEDGTLRQCALKTTQEERLKCYRHPEYGTAIVDEHTWRTALQNEEAMWHGSSVGDDRSDEHAEGYGYFQALGDNYDFGDVAEFGCGPWTQLLTCVYKTLRKRNIAVSFNSITLLEPNMENYVKNVPTCSYKSGKLLKDRDVPTYLVNSGAEAKLFYDRFDTLIMSNVLEHVQNAYDVLQNLYDSLKPGGVLIFHDRWWPQFDFDHADKLDNVLHPVRLHRPVFDWFTTHFDILYVNYEGSTLMKQRGDVGLYMIGRKKV